MILEIQHETRLRYSQPVAEWLAELRVEPVSDADQSCQTFYLMVSQPTGHFRFQDGFGNRVHHFNLLAPNPEVKVLSASIVETHPRPKDLAGSAAVYPLADDALPLETADYLRLRGPVRPTPKLDPVLRDLRPAAGDRLADVATAVTDYIHTRFGYAKAVTHAYSPIDDVLEKGKGVCQDFAHLMIGVLRAFGLPARYVSGYIHRPGQESQSHAWCEAWLPDLGWVGFDPTNNQVVGERFVKAAVGRDFSDVPPNKGLYRGAGEETIFARVETRELDRLPPLTWQEQLPEMQAPLTAVYSRLRPEPADAQDEQQQQQQQQ